MDAKQRLDAQVERARVAREEYLRKHPVKAKTLKQIFSNVEQARGEAEALARHDGDLDK